MLVDEVASLKELAEKSADSDEVALKLQAIRERSTVFLWLSRFEDFPLTANETLRSSHNNAMIEYDQLLFPCEPGYYCTGGLKYLCPAGYYCPAGASTKRACGSIGENATVWHIEN